jgi:integral membrane protein (TIGR01906 family)
MRLIIAILLPFVLVLTNVRLILTPVFVSVEYSTPGFPDDPYGFTREERVQLAQLARVYLLNDAGPEFLADQRDRQGNLLYDARELSHMIDVKQLVQRALTFWGAVTVILAAAALTAWRLAQPGTVRQGLWLGARITVAAMLALVVLLAVSFSLLFTGFHMVFFEPGTWVFYYSDTLIRLFPMRFWRDVFALLLILTLVEAGALWLVSRPPRQPNPS